MKIDCVLTACNLNMAYLNMFPYVYQVWKTKFNLDCYLILIADEIPNNLLEYKNFIILFKPIENINSCFVAQTIRILYPALFNNKNILITDIDIIPISKKYFIESIEIYDNNKFITYTDRYVKQNMYAICYNVANSNIWKEIFKVYNQEDVKNKIIEWYNSHYSGTKNCIGWFTDQIKLYEYLHNYNNLVILKDNKLGFKRLDKRQRDIDFINKNSNNLEKFCEIYSDFHISKKISIENTQYSNNAIKLIKLIMDYKD